MYAVYVISNEKRKIYIGQTDNLELRLLRHNKLLKTKKTSYTSIQAGPWRIIHREMFDTREDAMSREKYLKSHIGRNWLRNKTAGA